MAGCINQGVIFSKTTQTAVKLWQFFLSEKSDKLMFQQQIFDLFSR